jgi:serine/threonine protein kinase
MTVFQTLQCPQCGTVRASHAAPLDLCPACLLATAMAIDDEPCPYQVLAPIGEGARGVTYLAQPLSGLGGYVALKILQSRDDVDAVLSRYQQWKDALARIHHPGIATLLDVGLTADGLLYVASAYVPGWPLTAVASHPSFGASERHEIASQLTAAIQSAHAEGVVHLELDASKVKISTASGTHSTILGFGASLVLDGGDGDREDDWRALATIIGQLGVDPPEARYSAP